MKELKNILPETSKVLLKLSELELLQNYTFVGGSALAVYLGHRYSEDIDLFTWKKQNNIDKINEAIKQLNFNQIKLINISKEQIDFIIDNVKVTFFANNWSALKNRKHLINNLFIANLDVLTVMKVNTLFLRARFRDYYDLYVLNKERYTLEEIYNLAKSKLVNLTIALFQRALTFTGDIEDENINHLKPKYNITLKEIERHFINEIKKWNNSIKP